MGDVNGKKPVTAADVWAALRRRYAPPEYAMFDQVANGTGGYASRTADALAMSLWPSRGLFIHGFEIKVFRGDWTRELKNPAKAEAVSRFCDHWWIVAPASIVPPFDLPPTWGLLELHGSTLRVSVQAPKLDPEPITRMFLAGVLRRASTTAPGQAELEAAVALARQQGHEAGYKQGTQSNGQHFELETLKRRVREFESASGISIEQNGVKPLGAAVRAVMAMDPESWRSVIQQLQRAAAAGREITAAAELALGDQAGELDGRTWDEYPPVPA